MILAGLSISPAHAASSSSNAQYKWFALTDALKIKIDGVLNEKVLDGTRIGVVVDMKNTSEQITRVPLDALQVKTSTGETYTLNGSLNNPLTVEANEQVKLSYMLSLSRTSTFSLSTLNWVKQNKNVYPMQEKTVLSIPVASFEWRGSKNITHEGGSLPDIGWGNPFVIPGEPSSLVFQSVKMMSPTELQHPVTLIILQVKNNSGSEQSIHGFQIDGISAGRVYLGKNISQTPPIIEPGEIQYLYYTVSAKRPVQWDKLLISTPETFMKSDQAEINYQIGRYTLETKSDQSGTKSVTPVGKAIAFAPWNQLIPSGVGIAFDGMKLYQSADTDGYHIAVAKFVVTNNSNLPVSVPDFQAVIRSASGKLYRGSRQGAGTQMINPDFRTMVNCSFILPKNEAAGPMTMTLMDGQSLPSVQIPIATLTTNLDGFKSTTSDSTLIYSPYDVKISQWKVKASTIEKSATSRSATLTLNADIHAPTNMLVDAGYTAMEIETVNDKQQVLGTEPISFSGANRLMEGSNDIVFDNLPLDASYGMLHFKMYEVVNTPEGTAKRYLTTLQGNQ